ncbi:MAG: efflux RND transporter periplasmic adaptor subunit, partial [Tannerella sp.]|nr:efflux RND transporter periplasmic adaptor subunit [Tannerella sp.]
MKTYITGLFIITAVLFTTCDAEHVKDNHPSKDKHEHFEGDGHDHSTGDGHDHSDGDGHHHEGHDHSTGDGHNHPESDGHNHSDDDGHHHGEKISGHSDEISFTKKQAEAVGLTTEAVSKGTFFQVLKTSGQIQASQGDEITIVATSNGIVSFANPSLTEGSWVGAGQSLVTISAKKLLEGDPALKAKIEYESALKEYQRAESLIKDRIISAKDYEQAKLRYETAQTAYQAQASHITANGVSVTSPIGGYLKNRMVSQGAYVTVGQPIATVSQNKRLQLRAEVSENHYKMLKNINSAHFRPAYDQVVYKLSELNGRLLSFGKASDRQSFYIPVTFEFDNIGDIIPGSFTEVFLLSSPQ